MFDDIIDIYDTCFDSYYLMLEFLYQINKYINEPLDIII